MAFAVASYSCRGSRSVGQPRAAVRAYRRGWAPRCWQLPGRFSTSFGGRPSNRLAKALRRRDRAVLEQVYGEYAATVLGYLINMLGDRGRAEDVHQQVFLEVWQRAPDYDPRPRRCAHLDHDHRPQPRSRRAAPARARAPRSGRQRPAAACAGRGSRALARRHARALAGGAHALPAAARGGRPAAHALLRRPQPDRDRRAHRHPARAPSRCAWSRRSSDCAIWSRRRRHEPHVARRPRAPPARAAARGLGPARAAAATLARGGTAPRAPRRAARAAPAARRRAVAAARGRGAGRRAAARRRRLRSRSRTRR